MASPRASSSRRAAAFLRRVAASTVSFRAMDTAPSRAHGGPRILKSTLREGSFKLTMSCSVLPNFGLAIVTSDLAMFVSTMSLLVEM